MTETNPGDPRADLERSLLAGLLNSPDRMFEVEDYVSPDLFLGAGRRTVYEAMQTLHLRNADIDLLSVVAEVERQRGMPVFGITEAVASLAGFAVSGSHVLHHSRMLRSQHVLARVGEIAGEAIQEAPSVVPDEESVGEYLEGLMTDLYGLTQRIAKAKNTDLRSLVAETFKTLEARDGGVTGVRTGFRELDEKIHGLRPGQLVICGARPAMGKSAFATSIIMHAARSSEHESGAPARCALISLEMSSGQIVSRMLSSAANVDGNRLFAGRLDTDERERMRQAVQELGAMPVQIDDAPAMTVHQLRGKLRRIQQQHGLDLAIIDYIQLLRAGGKHDNRQSEVAEISRSLKSLARELKIPIVALCQLSRAVEQRDKKRPQLSDLRESGSIEQDADVVMFLYREGYYDQSVSDSKAEVIIAKNREGVTGSVKLTFEPTFTRFTNPDPVVEATDAIDWAAASEGNERKAEAWLNK